MVENIKEDIIYLSRDYPLEHLNPGTIIRVDESSVYVDDKYKNDILVIVKQKYVRAVNFTEQSDVIAVSVIAGDFYFAGYSKNIKYRILKLK